jgi:hypothetical protein
VLVAGGEERGHLRQEDAGGPAIGDDVMEREQEGLLLVGQLQPGDAQQRGRGQVEGTLRFGGRQPVGFDLAAGGGQVLQVDEGQGQSKMLPDVLGGCAKTPARSVGVSAPCSRTAVGML